MCLKTKQSTWLIADKDITCFKLLEPYWDNIRRKIAYRTPYRRTIICDNVINGKKDFCAVGHVGENPEEISVGAIHTFVNKKDAISEAKWFQAANKLNVYLVYSCVIPKGTSYYKGECTVYPVDSRQMCDYLNPIDFESYASGRIRFVKKVFKI